MTIIFRLKNHKTHTIVSKSESMRNVIETVQKVAPTFASVLIIGETGVGKELVARAIHEASNCDPESFYAYNCSALKDELLGSELFGHEKGAYTDAIGNREGLFERADRGTIFFDEIGEMSPSFQRMLLRVLQEKEFTRVGGNKLLNTDARILAATHRNMYNMVKSGEFREDLFFRLNVIKIHIPPLRDRKEDIMPLIKYFLEKYAHENRTPVPKITREAMTALIDYSFPGNIRELENIIKQAIILSNNHNICTDDLPEQVSQGCISRGEDQKYNINTENLLDVLNRAVICKTSDQSKLWYKSLKCITIEKIYKFLLKTNGNWFSRKDLAKFLKKNSKSDKNKYKTAGSYLKILKENHICVHNDKKANQSRYKLTEAFITDSYLWTLTKNHIKVHNDN